MFVIVWQRKCLYRATQVLPPPCSLLWSTRSPESEILTWNRDRGAKSSEENLLISSICGRISAFSSSSADHIKPLSRMDWNDGAFFIFCPKLSSILYLVVPRLSISDSFPGRAVCLFLLHLNQSATPPWLYRCFSDTRTWPLRLWVTACNHVLVWAKGRQKSLSWKKKILKHLVKEKITSCVAK